jgi:AcrR family transcriptional regulator
VPESSPPPKRQRKKGASSPRVKAASRSSAGGRDRARRRRLTLQTITATAIDIADAEGLDAVSIRRVAAELDARPMSLYGHISSKDDLLTSMADQVTEEILVRKPLPEDWREAVASIARRHYVTFMAHPWVVFLYAQRASFGSNATRLAKQMARAVAGLSLEPRDVWVLLGTVNDYALGYSLRAVATPMGSDLADAISQIDVVEFPELAALQETLRSRSSSDRFELGLQIVLDGIERRFVGNG